MKRRNTKHLIMGMLCFALFFLGLGMANFTAVAEYQGRHGIFETDTPSLGLTPDGTTLPRSTATPTDTPDSRFTSTPTNTPRSNDTPTNTPRSNDTPTNTPRSNDTPTNTPRSNDTPTNTPRSNDTPTNTPIPIFDTPTPTNTSIPISTNSPTPSVATATSTPADSKFTPTPEQKPTTTPEQKPTTTPEQKPTTTPEQKPTATPEQKPTPTPESAATPLPLPSATALVIPPTLVPIVNPTITLAPIANPTTTIAPVVTPTVVLNATATVVPIATPTVAPLPTRIAPTNTPRPQPTATANALPTPLPPIVTNCSVLSSGTNLRMGINVTRINDTTSLMCIEVMAGDEAVDLSDTVIVNLPPDTTVLQTNAGIGLASTSGNIVRWGSFKLAARQKATLVLTLSTKSISLDNTSFFITGTYNRGQAFQQRINGLPALTEIVKPTSASAQGGGGDNSVVAVVPANIPLTGVGINQASNNRQDWILIIGLGLIGLLAVCALGWKLRQR